MKKKKMHTVQPKKSEKIHIVIKPSDLNVPNKMHFNVQLNTRASIQEDKRFKKPKHKKKVFEED